jgi:hypothetical protein
MDLTFGKLILLAVLIVLIRPLMRIVFCLLARTVLRGWLSGVGAKALGEQPDAIHLEPRPLHEWKDAGAVEAQAAPLAARGFRDAGIHAVREMPGVVVRFLVQPDERVAACIYEHPRIGTWLDLVCSYQDGTGATYSTSKPTGLDTRPGQKKVNAPELGSAALYDKLLRERPTGDLEEWTVENVAGKFEAAYARETNWRKNKGISADEVARNIQSDFNESLATEHSG